MIKYLVFLSLFLNCCTHMNGLSQREILAHRIMPLFARVVHKEGFVTTSVGGGQKDGKQDELVMTFEIQEVLTIETARKYAVEKTLEFLAFINAQEKFRKYLIEYPLTLSHVGISISGQDPPDHDPSGVATVIVVNGRLFYHGKERMYPTFGLIHKETFEDALAHLNNPSLNPAK